MVLRQGAGHQQIKLGEEESYKSLSSLSLVCARHLITSSGLAVGLISLYLYINKINWAQEKLDRLARKQWVSGTQIHHNVFGVVQQPTLASVFRPVQKG